MKALSARLAMLALLAGLSGCGKGPSKDSRTNSPEKPGRASPVPMSPSAKPDETKSGGTRPRTTIKWLQWGPEAFALAEKQGKPVLLSISVSWSGACRKMDEETFSQPEIVETIQKRYIPIRVDSDERPDINIRYNQGGWPTVVFLSPEGEMLYGGTYYDRSRFASLLDEIANLYQAEKQQIREQAEILAKQRKLLSENAPSTDVSDVAKVIPLRLILILKTYYDEKDGGFADERDKFPLPDAIEFLLYEYALTGEQELLMMANRTLGAMAGAGIYDQIGGGFHRYAVSSDWRMPHFEKMCHENARHIENYLDAYQATGNAFYRRIAEETIGYVSATLSDPARTRGGFYASQYGGDDGYYTWSREQAAQILSPEETEIVLRYFGIGESRNETKEQKGEYVLNVGRSFQGIARELHVSANDVKERLEQALDKMRRARAARKAPPVDRRLFTDWNAMMASIFLHASVILGRNDLRDLALKTLDLLLTRCYRSDIGMVHCMGDGTPRISGLFSDQARMAQALLDAYLATGDPGYLKKSKDIVSIMRSEFEDKEGGGFYDRIKDAEPIGRLAMTNKSMDANAAAARCLIRLAQITGNKQYEAAARRALGAFTQTYEEYGARAVGYALAVEEFLQPPLRLIVFGPMQSPATRALLRESIEFYEPRKIVIPLDPTEDDKRLKAFGLSANARDGIYPCYKGMRGEPISSPTEGDVGEALKEFVKKNLKPEG